MSLAEDAEEPATSGFPNPLSLSRLPNPENTDFIDRLPWELLKKIMWDCTHVFNLQDLAEPDCTHRWDYLVSVSRLWRTIALRSPTLWSQIHLHWSLRDISKFLTRSHNAPLSIGGDQLALSSPIFSILKPLLIKRLDRVERLSLVVNEVNPLTRSEIAENLRWICGQIFDEKHGAPYLRFIEISLAERGLLDALPLVNIPRLSRMLSHNIPIYSDIFSSLTLTYVQFTIPDASFDLTTFLSCVPMLECGHFVDVSRKLRPTLDNFRGSPKNSTIPLLYLQYLFLYCFDDIVNDAVIRAINYPNSAAIGIYAVQSPGLNILHLVPKCLRAILSSCSVISLHLTMRGNKETSILEFKTSNSANYTVRLGRAIPHLAASNSLDIGGLVKIIADLSCGQDSLPQLKEILFFSPVTAFPPPSITIPLFRSLPNLEKITVKTSQRTDVLAERGIERV